MSDKLRIIHRKIGTTWVRVRMSELVADDIIKINEPTGEPVTNSKGDIEFLVKGEPFESDDCGSGKVWTVKTEPLENVASI